MKLLLHTILLALLINCTNSKHKKDTPKSIETNIVDAEVKDSRQQIEQIVDKNIIINSFIIDSRPNRLDDDAICSLNFTPTIVESYLATFSILGNKEMILRIDVVKENNSKNEYFLYPNKKVNKIIINLGKPFTLKFGGTGGYRDNWNVPVLNLISIKRLP